MKTVKTAAVRIAALSALFLSLLFAPVGGHLFADEESLQSREFKELLESREFKEFLRSWEFMGVSEVCQRWGDMPLDVAAFRSAEDDEPVRAAMTCSLLKNQDDYAGLHVSEIRSLFGDDTGYFWNEVQPTYLIEIAKTKEENTWQIVFLHDRERRVTKIVVHKNCCEKILLLNTLN